MRAIIYSRVSTDAQERDGTSLDTQERGCLELAEVRGWSVVGCVRDSASGYSLDRPGIEEVRQRLRTADADVVVAYAVDRLSRNQNHIGVIFDEVEQAGAQLEFVTERFEDTAIGRFILAARAFIAEVEREKIAERTMRGKEERARSGKIPQATGAGIYGYRYDPASGQRVVDLVQAQVVRQIFTDFVANGTCHGIAKRLNAEGIAAFGGGRWYAPTVRRMLLNETYTGRTIYRRTVAKKVRDPLRGRWVRRVEERDEAEWIEIEGATPTIISRDLFERAQVRLQDPERRRRRESSRVYPLRGRLRCVCGAAMTGHAVNRGRYHYYRCVDGSSGPNKTRCTVGYVRQERLETAVKAALRELLASPERVLAEARRVAEEASAPPEEIAAVVAELDEVERRQRRLAQLYTRGELPEDVLAAESRSLAERRWALEARQREISPRAPVDACYVSAITERLPEVLASIREYIERSDDEGFQLLLRAVDAQIKATPERAEVRGSVPINVQSDESFATIGQTWA
ncbi:MAG: recombinase family protein [Dehalococcoidia bacterium]